jgi:hypothetical protein
MIPSFRMVLSQTYDGVKQRTLKFVLTSSLFSPCIGMPACLAACEKGKIEFVVGKRICIILFNGVVQYYSICTVLAS